ncbi:MULTISPECIES: SecDF P1 head subdomain-containing protein [unclassified Nocardiopsis]|uniref:SecDF P1 head subdomain-containing protein n=1 Tax=Nocardiopsis TaxID=2013 RepID=UPI00387ACD1F
MDPQSPQAPDPASAPAPRRGRPWPLIAAGVAVALLLAVAGVGAWLLLWERPGGGETVELRLGDGGDVSARDIDRVAEILHRRIVAAEDAEPVITPGDGAALTVELPPDTDVRAAIALMERTGAMTIHPVTGIADGTGEPADGATVLPDATSDTLLELGTPQLDNAQIAAATAEIDTASGGWQVLLEFTPEGTAAWARATGEAACPPAGDPGRRLAIVVDGEIVSAPEVAPDVACGIGLDAGATVISGDFDRAEAVTLADLVGSDPLPVAVTALP